MRVDFSAQSTHDLIYCLSSISSKLDHFVSLESNLPGVIASVTRILPMYSLMIFEITEGVKRAVTWIHPETNPALLSVAADNANDAFRYFFSPSGDNPQSIDEDHFDVAAVEVSASLTTQNASDVCFFTALPLVTSHLSVFGIIQLSCTEPLNEGMLSLCSTLAQEISRAVEKNYFTTQRAMPV